MHQLIIIGNGFDRACGLNSDFGSFFSSRHDAGGVFLPSSGMETAWDIILTSIAHEDPLWCDVEAVVAKWVIGEEGAAPVVDDFGSCHFFPSGDSSAWRGLPSIRCASTCCTLLATLFIVRGLFR